MLPFLKRSQEGSASSPVEHVKRSADDDAQPEDDFDSLEAAAQDLITAVHSKDVTAVASALRAAFELCDSQPHTEGPHNG